MGPSLIPILPSRLVWDRRVAVPTATPLSGREE
jgi:hypothetical protein